MEVLFQNLHIKEELEIFDIEVEEFEEKPFLGFDDSETDVKLPLFYKGLLNSRVTADLVPLISNLLENYSAQFDEVNNTRIIKQELVELPNQVSKSTDKATSIGTFLDESIPNVHDISTVNEELVELPNQVSKITDKATDKVVGTSLDESIPNVYDISTVNEEVSSNEEIFKTIPTVVEELLPTAKNESSLFPGILNGNQLSAIQPFLEDNKNFTFDAKWDIRELNNYTYCEKVYPETLEASQNSNSSLENVHFAQIKGFKDLSFSKKYLRFYSKKIVKLYIARSIKNKTAMARRKKFFLERKPPFAKAMRWRQARSFLHSQNENNTTPPEKLCENNSSYLCNKLNININNQSKFMTTNENSDNQNFTVVTGNNNEMSSLSNIGTTTPNTNIKSYQNICNDKEQQKCLAKQESVSSKIFSCKFCTFRSAQNFSLQRHIATKHSQNTKKSGVVIDVTYQEKTGPSGYSIDRCENQLTVLTKKYPVICLSRCDDENLTTSINVPRINDYEKENLQEQLQETDDCYVVRDEYTEDNVGKSSIDFIHNIMKDQNVLKFKKNKQKHVCKNEGNNVLVHITDELPVNEIVFKKCNRHTKSKEVHTCSTCIYSTDSFSEFEKHLKTHSFHNKPQFSCDYCEVSCSSQSSLSRHKILKHSTKKRYECKLCNFKCAIPQYLQSHFQVHTSLRAFPCNKCSFRAKTEIVLKNHINRHNKIKPFVCNFCDYRCDNKSVLKAHNFIHTGETDHVCEFCPYKAATSYALKRHMKVHGNIK